MLPLPFITFEGSEGCGKSTQVQRLAARLEQVGVPCLVTREPGGTPVGERVRRLVLEQRAHSDSLHGGDRARHHPPDKRRSPAAPRRACYRMAGNMCYSEYP